MADEIKRLHYYNQQFLREPDFTDEQRYHMEMRRRLNKRLHGWGIVDGLQVTRKSDHVITVSPGMAIDSDGREIVLFQPHDINLPSGVLEQGRQYYITIRYNLPEDLTDPPSPEDMITPADRTRVTERPDFPPPGTSVAHPDVTLILGRVSLANSGEAPILLPIDYANKQYIPISVDGKIGIGNPAPADSLDVNGDIRIRGGDIKDAGGTARVTLTDNGNLDLKEDGGISKISIRNNGNVGINTTAPEDTLDVNGDIRIRGADVKDTGGTSRVSLPDNANLSLNDHNGTARLTVGPTGVDVNGDIIVRGADIKDTGGTARVSLPDNSNLSLKDHNGGARINVSTTGAEVNGNLHVTGSITSPEGTLRDNNGGWVRTYGNTGWYNQDHGGGWYMSDTTWIRSYGNKSIYHSTGNMRTDGTFQVGNNGGTLYVVNGGNFAYRSNVLFANTGGNVGIGTTSPGAKLHVNGDLRLNCTNNTQPSISGSDLFIGWNWTGGRGETVFFQHGANGWRSGFDFHTQRDGVPRRLQARIEDTGNLNIRGGFGSLSDRREKTDIKPIPDSLSKIKNLRGVLYKWKDKTTHDDESHYGLIAQEVANIIPECVTHGIGEKDASNKYLSLRYQEFIPVLIEALKEQQGQIDSLINMRSGCDFSEYFESLNGKSIKPGTSVVVQDGKVRAAKKEEIPVGVISASPNVVGGLYMEWPGKYLRDEFGQIEMEKNKEEIMKIKTKSIRVEKQAEEVAMVEDEPTSTEIIEKNGKYIQIHKKNEADSEVTVPKYKEVDLYDESGKNVIGKHKVPVMETYEEEVDEYDEEGMPVLEGTGKFTEELVPKINPNYDEAREYIPRDMRPEWHCVGLLGQVPLKKGQPTAPGWIKIRDVSDKVEMWLIK